MNMINGIVRSCSFFVLAVLRSMTSGYTVPYMVFAVIAVIGGILIVAVKGKRKLFSKLNKNDYSRIVNACIESRRIKEI